MANRWTEFRHRQRESLRESNRIRHQDDEARGSVDVVSGEAEDTGAAPAPAESAGPSTPRYGTAGRPFNRRSPFYLGFVGGIGVLLAIGLFHALGRLSSVITIIVVSLFLALALEPLVQWLTGHGLPRGRAVAVVFAGVLVLFVLLGFVVVPPVITQGGELVKALPDYLDRLLNLDWVKQLDKDYGIVAKAQEEVTKRLQDPDFLSGLFGGVVGAGKALATGIFQAFTVLILTLYLLAALPGVKRAAYAMVPSSRRARVEPLSEEIMRRVGSYAIGQIAVATVNAICSYLMMTIIGIPFAAVLAVVVGFLGLIPMVGATLGAIAVCTVGFFDEPRNAVIAAIYYVVYQQLENYVIAPRIMQRTVSVPGAVTVVAALAGGALLGVLGALLAIPVAAGLLLLREEVLLPRQAQQ